MSIKGKKLNKGEWAEFYVMLRLLGEGDYIQQISCCKRTIRVIWMS